MDDVAELEALVRCAAAGDARALDHLLRRLRPEALRLCARFLPNHQDAEEACPFWSRVRREWVERVDPRDDIEDYPKLQNDFELKRRWPHLLREELSVFITTGVQCAC